MSALAVSSIVLAFLLGGAMLGMLLRKVLPDHHLSDESKDIVRLGTGLLATLSALVLGLLIAAAKGSYDTKSDEVRQGATKIIVLDRSLRRYGPEADEIRAALRGMLAKLNLSGIEDSTHAGTSSGGAGTGTEQIEERLGALMPASDAQKRLQTRALQLVSELGQTRWLLVEQRGSSIPMPFLMVLVLWLTVIFASFGLFGPRHATVYAVIFACALSVSSAIFLIMELDQPFTGLLRISKAPLQDAVSQITR